MKTSHDPRHKKRQELVQTLFAHSFQEKKHPGKSLAPILGNIEAIDKEITRIAPEYPTDKINKIDLAVLRLAVFELLIDKKEPPKVIIDEAIELAKEFGTESSPAFINGALANLIKNG